MKKSLLSTLALAFAMSLSTTPVLAQDDEIDNTFAFVDADGNVVPDGSIVTISKPVEEDDGFGGVIYQMPSGLFVRNSDDQASLLVNYDIARIDNGRFQICFPSTCISRASKGSYKTTGGTLKANETRNLQTEWLPESYGQCEARLQLVLCVEFGKQFEEIANGPAITLRFNFADPASVNSAMQVVRPVAYYGIDGSRQKTAQRGIQLVRFSDGTVRKVIRK